MHAGSPVKMEGISHVDGLIRHEAFSVANACRRSRRTAQALASHMRKREPRKMDEHKREGANMRGGEARIA